jgi:hypothetical protein
VVGGDIFKKPRKSGTVRFKRENPPRFPDPVRGEDRVNPDVRPDVVKYISLFDAIPDPIASAGLLDKHLHTSAKLGDVLTAKTKARLLVYDFDLPSQPFLQLEQKFVDFSA